MPTRNQFHFQPGRNRTSLLSGTSRKLSKPSSVRESTRMRVGNADSCQSVMSITLIETCLMAISVSTASIENRRRLNQASVARGLRLPQMS